MERAASQHRDVTAWAQAHRLEIWRYLRYLGCEAHLADDLVQEVFLRAMRAAFADRGPRARAAWLRAIAGNLYRQHLRGPEALSLDEAEATWQARCGDDGGESYVHALRACVGELPPRLRSALDMRYAENASREVIGARLAMRPDGVKSLLRRARELLRRCIERRLS